MENVQNWTGKEVTMKRELDTENIISNIGVMAHKLNYMSDMLGTIKQCIRDNRYEKTDIEKAYYELLKAYNNMSDIVNAKARDIEYIIF